MASAPWLEEARKHVNTREFKGKADNPKIVGWMKYTTLPKSLWHDSTYWCSVFMCFIVEFTGYKSSRNAMARSWLRVGTKCKCKPGAIAVFPRGKPPSGHVAVVESVDWKTGTMITIDGNVSDQVKRVRRRINSALGYRWPSPKVIPVREAVKETVKTTTEAVKETAKSQSVWAQFVAMIVMGFGVVTDWTEKVFNVVFGAIGALPSVAGEIETNAGASQKFATWLGVPWAQVSLYVVLGLMGVVVIRHVRDKMKLARAENETPQEPPVEDDEIEDETIGLVEPVAG